MLYVVSPDILTTTKHVLDVIDSQFLPTHYINCGLPTRLYNLVTEGTYQFKTPHNLKLFNYHKVNDLAELQQYVDGMEEDREQYVIVEGLSSIVNLTHCSYADLNCQLVQVMLSLKASGKRVYVTDQTVNGFIELQADGIKVLQ